MINDYIGSRAIFVRMDKVGVLLISGGVESVTLLAQLVDGGDPLQALFIDYGQRAAKLERQAAESACARVGIELVAFDLAGVGEQFRNVQQRKAHIPLPHRNLVALALGLSYATTLESARLYLAANREDTSAYASSSHLFLAQFRVLAGVLGNVQLLTPLVGLSKAEIINRGHALGVDYASTYSCMLGYAVHCGRCAQCMHRKAAFHEAGFDEPADFYRA